MKKIILSSVFALFGVLLFAQTPAQTNSAAPEAAKKSGAEMTLEATEIDYGTIDQGSDPLRIFKYKNTGTEPLIIKSAKGSCGCTVPTFSKEPVMPGESGQVEVRYDTQRVGPFSKRVTLETNEDIATRGLSIKGEVRKTVPDNPVPTVQPNVLQTGGGH